MPQISVIVPVYNVEKYIHRCVDSILVQTYTDFELILVDDGSPDHCNTICDEYAAIDSRVRVIHQENGGPSAARNAGIDWVVAHSDSEWISFIDGDDWVHPVYLEALYHAAKSQRVRLSVCGYRETQGEQTPLGAAVARLWSPEDFYIAHNVNAIVVWGKLYRKEDFLGVRFPEGLIHEDEFLVCRTLFAHEKIAVIEEPLYAYFYNPEGITKSAWTPKRLDVVEGLNRQRNHFRKHGFDRAYRAATNSCVSRLCTEITRLENLPEYRSWLRKMRKALRKLLHQERKLYPFVQENFWSYELAYPRSMYLYWTGVGICNKVRKEFEKCRR